MSRFTTAKQITAVEMALKTAQGTTQTILMDILDDLHDKNRSGVNREDYADWVQDEHLKKLKTENVVIPIPMAKHFSRSFKNRFEKIDTQYRDLEGKNEVEGLSEDEWNIHDTLEPEIEVLKEVINAINGGVKCK